MSDPKIITSPLSGPYSEGGLTVDVQIYRLENSKWTLEVIDSGAPRQCGMTHSIRPKRLMPNSAVALQRKASSA